MEKGEQIAVVQGDVLPKIPKSRVPKIPRTQPPAKKKLTGAISMEMVLMKAVNRGMDAQALEKLVDLKLKLDADEARKAFSNALAKFQGQIENVNGTKEGSKTKSGIVTFRYAPLGDIMYAIRKPLTENGLSVTFDSEFLPEKKVRKTSCTVTHELGHKETSYFESEIDPGTSLMNPLQKQGSTLKYGQRYSLCMALGIVTEAEDDDGAAGGKVETKNGKLITENQAKKITAMINGRIEVETLVLNAYEVATIDLIPAEMFDDCIGRLEAWNTKEK